VKTFAGIFFSAFFISNVASAQEALGGPGESCRARADCKTGLKCINQACADEHEGQSCAATSDCGGELKCIKNKCSSGVAKDTAPEGKKTATNEQLNEWLHFNLQGVHPFAGLTWGGGFMTGGITGNGAGLFRSNFDSFFGNFLFALNGGVFIDRHQLQVELAPFTYFFTLAAGNPGPAFEVTGSYAYFIPLYDSETLKVSWPLRIGVGIVAGANNTGGLAYFQPRADLIGVALQVGHIMIDMHLPSFRYAVTDRFGTQGHVLSWIFGASISYVF